MPINYYSVLNHLAENGWKLISTEYKNLDTELEMECPKGHKQIQTYKHWRKYQQCDLCVAGDPFKGKKNTVPIKKIDTYRILALDAATNITGYAVYDDKNLVGYGTYKTNENNDVTERINEMKHWLEKVIDIWLPDKIGIENIQLQNFGGNNSSLQVELYRKLACLQGVLVDTCFERQIPCELVYATVWRRFCAVGEGVGRENKKAAAQKKVFDWYKEQCTQDEADAICIGKYFCSKNKRSTWGENL